MIASTDVGMTPFEVWGWVLVALLALALMLSGLLLDTLGEARPGSLPVDSIDPAELARRERAELARMSALRRAEVSERQRAEAAARGRLAGVTHARSHVPTHRRWRDDMPEARR
jgi:hypothetical protein